MRLFLHPLQTWRDISKSYLSTQVGFDNRICKKYKQYSVSELKKTTHYSNLMKEDPTFVKKGWRCRRPKRWDKSSSPDWLELHYIHAWYGKIRYKLADLCAQTYICKLGKGSTVNPVSSLSNAHNQCGIMRMEQQHQNLRIWDSLPTISRRRGAIWEHDICVGEAAADAMSVRPSKVDVSTRPDDHDKVCSSTVSCHIWNL